MMALASVYRIVQTAGNLSAELRKANGYLVAGSAAIVAALLSNYASATYFADERSLRFTMLWLLLVVVLAPVSWFASVFIAARLAGLSAALSEDAPDWELGEREGFLALQIKGMFPPMRWYAKRQIAKVENDLDAVGIASARWSQIQGLTTLLQFLFVAIAAGVLFEGLKFG